MLKVGTESLERNLKSISYLTVLSFAIVLNAYIVMRKLKVSIGMILLLASAVICL
jgi:hypothetical protein